MQECMYGGRTAESTNDKRRWKGQSFVATLVKIQTNLLTSKQNKKH